MPGWFHIESTTTGQWLSQMYRYHAPALVSPPIHMKSSQCRDSWGFQWTLIHPACYDKPETTGRNVWYIKNRLTGTLLSPRFQGIRPETLEGHNKDLVWQLELDQSNNWKILNLATSCFLEQIGTGGEVMCCSQTFQLQGGRKSWILRYPNRYAIASKLELTLVTRQATSLKGSSVSF